MPLTSDKTAPVGFEPILFWESHKAKVLLYAGLLIGALIIFGIYQTTTLKRKRTEEQVFAQADTPEEYRRIIKDFPGSVVAGNAQLLLAAQLRGEKKYDEAIEILRHLIAEEKNHPLLNGAWLSLASTYEAQGKTAEALETYQQVTSRFPGSYSSPVAALAQANLLKSQGKNDEAKRAFESIISQYPESYFSAEATRHLQVLKK
jgi:TolA-binding protein